MKKFETTGTKLACIACALARPQFQYLAYKNKCDNNDGCFIINRHPAVHNKGVREQAGKECGNQAVQIGSAHAEHNQGPHVVVSSFN